MINNSVFGKTIENITKYRYIKLATTERIRNYLVSEPNYHTFLVEYLLATETKKVQIFTNKPVYFGLSILELKKKKIKEWVLVWLCKSRTWWKSKIVLYGVVNFVPLYK